MSTPSAAATDSPASSPATGAPSEPEPGSFHALLRQERTWIGSSPTRPRTSPSADAGLRVSTPGAAGEPWVSFTSDDYFGIALSGGGIRSATFNLGLVQALEEQGILKEADYLSTVSGGGYVGGFLTAWRHHHPHETFPTQNATGSRPPDLREPAPIRHLREFSRFLMPRTGVFAGEMWNAVVTIVGGMLPSLAFACAVLLAGVTVWAILAYFVISAGPLLGAAVLVALTLSAMAYSEILRRHEGKVGIDELLTYAGFALFSTLTLGTLWWLLRHTQQTAIDAVRHGVRFNAPFWEQALAWAKSNFDVWSLEWPDASSTWSTIGAAYAPAVAWTAVGLLLLFVRAVSSGWRRGSTKSLVNWSGTFDRVITAHLVLALLWSALASEWALARWMWVAGDSKAHPNVDTWLGVGTAGTVGLFALIKNWLNQPIVETRGTTIARKLLVFIRPKIPQVVAFAAVALLVASTALALISAMKADDPESAFKWLLGSAAAVIAITLICFDPSRVGMHDFYRARICRCFLGAAHAKGEDISRATTEQPTDDLRVKEIRDRNAAVDDHRTLHLVCCIANNLAGDALRNLYRGGRSAVISAHGIAVGDDHASIDSLRLSSALTASAAAFNSQMGRLSMNYGPAVSFMMTALNLRLGLWVPHPASPGGDKPLFPGLPYFWEMLGRTSVDLPEKPATPRANAKANARAAKRMFATIMRRKGSNQTNKPGRFRVVKRVVQGVANAASTAGDRTREFRRRGRLLHLSDGGHFENLALYELVRRHCRYIIVSDCGADPDVVFDDLAVALRTIREDFGIEIEIDVTPLRPDEHGRSRQHAVVGTIHYNGPTGFDKGTLIYFKPTLTGDEPPDVVQYQSRNRTFPHETTGDQFYDEAQWESYRRLGQHCGSVVLRFVESYDDRRRGSQFIENIFLDATRTWHAGPDRQADTFLALTERRRELDDAVRTEAPAALRAEFFPEFAPEPKPGDAPDDFGANPDAGLFLLMRAAQLMEDVWVGADLDRYWAHPLNDGWMNYFHRWAATPSFRRWWPILRPIYCIGFRDFVRDRFRLTYDDGKNGANALLELKPATDTRTGLAWEHLRRRRPAVNVDALPAFEYRLTLDHGVANAKPLTLVVGVWLHQKEGDVLRWDAENLYVPPSLNGAGITARLLDAVIKQFANDPNAILRVSFPPKIGRDLASRYHRLHDINFYKSRGFTFRDPDDTHADLRPSILPKAVAPARRPKAVAPGQQNVP